MSAFTPVNRRRPHGETKPLWWLLSLGLHVTILALVIWLGPVREYQQRAREKQELTLQGDQLETLMNQVQHLQEEAIREKVTLLRRIEDEMDAMNRNEQAILREQQSDARKNGPANALQAQEQALKKQVDALLDLEAFPPHFHAVRQSEQPLSGDNQNRVAQARDQIQIDQAEAGLAQAEALNAIELGGSFFDSARTAQESAQEAQRKADEAQTASGEAVMASLRAARTLQDTMQRASMARDKRDQAAAALQSKQALAVQAETAWNTTVDTSAQARKTFEAARQQVQDSRSELNRARQEARKKKQAPPADMEMRLKTLEETSRQQEAVYRQAAQTERDVRKSKDKAAREHQQAQQNLQRADTEWQRRAEQLAQAQAEAGQQRDLAETSLTAVVHLQKTAHGQQRIAHDLLLSLQRQLEQNPALQPPENLASPQMPATPPLHENLDVVELYQDAVQTESRLTESYRQVRAAELAMIQNYSFQKALAATEVARPVRPKLNAQAIRNTVRNAAQLEAYKAEVTQVELTVDSMVELAVDMLENARNLNQATEEGISVALERISQQAEHYQQLAAAAQDDNQQRGRDLSGLMRRGDTPEAKQHPTAAPGPSRSWEFRESIPPPPPDMQHVLPARKVMRFAGDTVRWMFVDSWYVIGPWPNQARVNIDTKFPPESVVDLDATYVGKRNQIIRWEFDQASEPRIFPRHDEEYAIYYAYTELYFEQPMDTWIAVGSDDKSKIWINGDLVWISADHLKSWRIDEGFRKVHFQKGRNQILYRVENGWHTTQYSLCIALPGEG